MRIGYNAVNYQRRVDGAGRVFVNTFKRILSMDRRNKYIFYVSKAVSQIDEFEGLDSFKTVRTPLKRDNVWQRSLMGQLYWPKQAERDGLDIYHTVEQSIPPRLHSKVVMSIYDLRDLDMPECSPRWRHWHARLLLPVAMRRADCIITISEFMRQRIIEFLTPGHCPEVVTIPLAVPDIYHVRPSEDEIDRVRARRKLPERFLLAVGHLERRKNLVNLVKALYLLREKYNLPHKLVVVGRQNEPYGEFFRTIEELALTEHVVLTGYVPDEQMPAIYASADAFVFPSTYEGFGIPVLEAMATGVPVISSSAAALPEVVGNAGRLFDPYDPDDIAFQIASVVTDGGLTAELVKRGKERVKCFSWDRAAEMTLGVYERLTHG